MSWKSKEDNRADAYRKARDVWVGLGQVRRQIDEGASLGEIRRHVNDLVEQAGVLIGKLSPSAHS